LRFLLETGAFGVSGLPSTPRWDRLVVV